MIEALCDIDVVCSLAFSPVLTWKQRPLFCLCVNCFEALEQLSLFSSV